MRACLVTESKSAWPRIVRDVYLFPLCKNPHVARALASRYREGKWQKWALGLMLQDGDEPWSDDARQGLFNAALVTFTSAHGESFLRDTPTDFNKVLQASFAEFGRCVDLSCL